MLSLTPNRRALVLFDLLVHRAHAAEAAADAAGAARGGEGVQEVHSLLTLPVRKYKY